MTRPRSREVLGNWMVKLTADERWRQYEALGEEAVRKNILDGIIGPEQEPFAREWLAHKKGRNARAIAVRAERRANIALAISIIGIVVSVLLGLVR
jgi:hypothetical protein